MARWQTTSSTNYTKVTIKRELYGKVKIRAADLNRSVSNYIEDLILRDFAKNYTSGEPKLYKQDGGSDDHK